MVYQEKKIVQDVSGWLRVYDDDRTWTGPQEVRFMMETVPSHENFVDGVAVKDVIVDEISGLRVRIYLPEQSKHDENPNNLLPIILHFQGRGFCISQPDWYMYYHIYTRLCRSLNAVVVSVYQRLAPEHRLPAAIDDCLSGLLYLHSVALADQTEPWLQTRADFKRVFLIGDSSGGNIVHYVAALAGDQYIRPLKLAGGIPIHPGFVRAKRSKSELEMPQSPFLTLEMVDKFLGLALPVGSTKDDPITCPMMGSSSFKAVNLPPFLLYMAEKDLIIDTEMEYYEAMKKARKEVEIYMSKGMMHSFYLNKIAVDMDLETAKETERLIEGIKGFVNKWEKIRNRPQCISNSSK